MRGGVKLMDIATFPSTEAEALAMLYVKSQELRGLSPTELLEMYQGAYCEIREALSRQYEARFDEI